MWEEDFSAVKAYIDSLRVADLRSYLAARPEAVAECVRRVRIIDVNRAARDFYGAAGKEELLGDLSGMFDEKAYEIFPEEIAAPAASRSPFEADFQTPLLT